MTKPTAGLVGTMVSGCPAHSARRRQGRERLRALQKSNRFINRAGALFRADLCATRQHQDVAVHSAPQFLDKSGVKRGILARQIHLANYGLPRCAFVVFFLREGRYERDSGKEERENQRVSHYSNYSNSGATAARFSSVYFV